jgi:MtrB/PioB family decaheme-associated outer membrane protein
MHMKTSNRLLFLSVLSALSGAASAADGASVNTSEWKCESCKFEQGRSGSIELGAGSVSEKSARFGDYTGLNHKGAYFIGDGDVRFRGKDGAYLNVNAANIGLDARAIDAEGGRQGTYKLLLKYDQIPHFVTNSAQTPFNGNGGAALSLPAGYPQLTTPTMGGLQQVEIGTQRKRFGAGASWIPLSNWEYAVNFRHETREGTKRSAGAFFVNAANLVEPVSYETDQLDASASYTGRKWQAKLAYSGSTFRNANDALTWQNPFTQVPPPPPVIGSGQLALPPDNQFHQLLASAGYQFTERTRASADVAFGRMSQNETFLTSALAPLPGLGALPLTSLNGRADTLNANLKLSSELTNKIRLNAAYGYNDRNNHTAQASYPSVATDMFVGAPRTNMPYGFNQEKWKLSAEYKATAATRASVGYDNDKQTRTYQAVDRTRDETAWGKVSSRFMEIFDLSLKLAHGERRNAGYSASPGVMPIENPLLRKYNLASRTRETVGVRADIAAHERVNIGIGVDSSKDDYSDSSIGLISGSDFNVNGDISVIITPQTSVHLFANRELIKSKQAGSQTFSTPDWTGENKDTIDFVGLGMKHAAIKDKLDVGADLGKSRSDGQVNVLTGVSNPAFPNIGTSLDTFKLYANYRMKENVTLNAGYWHERFDSRNWMLEGLNPGTVPNFLSFGESAPRYKVNVVRVSMKYKF